MGHIALAKGGDGQAKGLSSCVGPALYRSLESSRKELIKKAMRAGEINLINKDSYK